MAAGCGRSLSIRGEFGYWVFEGDWQPGQRPSWNYRAEEGGGIVLDMLPHWQYLLENLFGPVRAVQCVVATHIGERWDEEGRPYRATADDAAYSIFELDGGVIAQINSSWAVRPFRDELVEFQVDGTEGSAVAGLRRGRGPPPAGPPPSVWGPDPPAFRRPPGGRYRGVGGGRPAPVPGATPGGHAAFGVGPGPAVVRRPAR